MSRAVLWQGFRFLDTLTNLLAAVLNGLLSTRTMLKRSILIALFATFSAAVEAADTYQISGDVAGLVDEGEAVLATSSDVLSGRIEISRAKIRSGKFDLAGEFDEVERATVTIVTLRGEGRGSVSLVLEAAPTRVSYQPGREGLRIEGGEYNQRLITSWQQSEVYQEALTDLTAIASKRDAAKGATKEALNKKYWEQYYVMPKIGSDAIDAIAMSDEDPLASSLAIQLGALKASEEAVARLNELEKKLGPHQGLANRRAAIKRSLLERSGGKATGTNLESVAVEGKDIAGKTFKLDAVLKENEYVLLEFWASWCGACLKEVPHMKQAHEAFSGNGFEIYSFSLDDEREAWLAASKRVAPPWINVSDLKAYESPVATKYGVNLIPRNFLLDKKGNIVARDLRGEALTEKLNELLGKQTP